MNSRIKIEKKYMHTSNSECKKGTFIHHAAHNLVYAQYTTFAEIAAQSYLYEHMENEKKNEKNLENEKTMKNGVDSSGANDGDNDEDDKADKNKPLCSSLNSVLQIGNIGSIQ